MEGLTRGMINFQTNFNIYKDLIENSFLEVIFFKFNKPLLIEYIKIYIFSY